MPTGSWIPSRVRRHADVMDIGAGVAVFIGVLAIALLQWGITDEGWTRGVTLGAALGLVVAIAVRRDRLRRVARERADGEQRLQLARELHDAVASQVGIIGIQAAAARRILATDPSSAAGSLEAIELAARTANTDLRRMLGTLRSEPTAPAPRLHDLPALVGEYRAQGLAVELRAFDAPRDLEPGLDAVAYRIVQEALANALAHAGRVQATVDVAARDGALRLLVINQPGHPASVHRGSGLGLQGMQERVALHGGTLRAGLGIGGEFVVDATLPVRRG